MKNAAQKLSTVVETSVDVGEKSESDSNQDDSGIDSTVLSPKSDNSNDSVDSATHKDDLENDLEGLKPTEKESVPERKSPRPLPIPGVKLKPALLPKAVSNLEKPLVLPKPKLLSKPDQPFPFSGLHNYFHFYLLWYCFNQFWGESGWV